MRYTAEQLMKALVELIDDEEFLENTDSCQYGAMWIVASAINGALDYNDMDDERAVDPVTLEVHDKGKNDELRTQAHDYKPGTFVKSREGAVYHVGGKNHKYFTRLRHPDGSVDSTHMPYEYALVNASWIVTGI